MFTREELESVARKELQALAKQHGVKANGSSDSIITNLLKVAEEATEEEKEVVTENEPDQEAVVESEAMEEPVAEEVVKTVEASGPLEKGDSAFALLDEAWVAVAIKRVNKKTFRVALEATGEEYTVPIEEVQRCKPAEEAAPESEVEERGPPQEEEVQAEEEDTSAVPMKNSEEEEAVQVEEVVQTLLLPEPSAVARHKPTKAQQLRDSAVAAKIDAMARVPVRPPSFASSSFKGLPVTPSRRKTLTQTQEAEVVIEAEEGAATPKVKRTSVAPTTPAAGKTPRVDFSASHPKQFQNSKPISAMVSKNKDIEARMDQAMHAELKTAAPAATVVVKPATAAPVAAANPFAAAITGRSAAAAKQHKQQRDSLYGKNTFGGGSSEQKALSLVANKSHLPSSAIGTKPRPKMISSRASIMGPSAVHRAAPSSSAVPAAAAAAANEPEFKFKARPMPKFYNKENKQTTAPAATAVVHIAATESATGVTSRRPMTKLTANRFSMMPDMGGAAGSVTKVVKPTATGTSSIADKARNQRKSMYAAAVKDKRADAISERRRMAF